MRAVSLLGSTGSIGTQTLDVISSREDRFRVVALAAGGTRLDLIARQATRYRPNLVAIADEAQADGVGRAIAALDASYRPKLVAGTAGVVDAARVNCDVVLNAITGSAGLLATLAALETGHTLALANKESLVIGGALVTSQAAPGQLVAVDSEHSAFAQALRSGRADEVRRLILTASGGPFRGKKRNDLLTVTPEQAMAHPTWNMGRVITINSATLVNKGLELIEAALLYGVNYDDIQVVVHPQSVVHSMVEFVDGSTLAQASPPDMRLPIALGLDWPNRVAAAAQPCDWSLPQQWTFEPLDNDAFPAVELARSVGRRAGTAPAVYNAANEVCVDAFCAGRIGYVDIVDTVGTVVAEHLAATGGPLGCAWQADAQLSVAGVLAADEWARQRAHQITSGNKDGV